MKRMTTNLLLVLALTGSLAMLGAPALALNGTGNVKTNIRIFYHNVPVRWDTSHVYLIWYGMASTIAYVLDTGWFDRYDLENADKCEGSFGET